MRAVLFASLVLFSMPHGGSAAEFEERDRIVSHIKRAAVHSTALASAGYSKRLHALEIEFRNGAIYRYLDVSPQVYRNFVDADSKARFYDDNIRGRYRSLHVRPHSL